MAKIVYSKEGRTVIVGGEDVPVWEKVTVTYAQLAAAALTNSITLLELPAGGIIHAVKIKHSVAFTGGAISAYSVSVGIAGNTAKYASLFDVFQAADDESYQITDVLAGEDHDTAVNILVTALAVGANLSAAGAGSVDIWVLRSTPI